MSQSANVSTLRATRSKTPRVLAFASSAGEAQLTPRQNDILRLALNGKTNHEISDELGIVQQAVRNSFSAIYRKLGVENRVQLLTRFQGKLPAQASRPVPVVHTSLATAEKLAILEALLQARGSTSGAAKHLRISKAQLQQKIKLHFL